MPATTEQLDARIARLERMVAELATIVRVGTGPAVLVWSDEHDGWCVADRKTA